MFLRLSVVLGALVAGACALSCSSKYEGKLQVRIGNKTHGVGADFNTGKGAKAVFSECRGKGVPSMMVDGVSFGKMHVDGKCVTQYADNGTLWLETHECADNTDEVLKTQLLQFTYQTGDAMIAGYSDKHYYPFVRLDGNRVVLGSQSSNISDQLQMKRPQRTGGKNDTE